MVKIAVLNTTPEQMPLFFSNLKEQDRFLYSRVTHREKFLSRKKLKGLTAKSLILQVAALWNNLTDEEKNDWTLAGEKCDLNGYRLFVKDTTHRLQLGYTGLATPNLYHQDKVGKILIEAPATQIKLIQFHPSSYYVYRKVTGKQAMFQPVKVTETFGLPFTLTVNYKSDLVQSGGNPVAKMYALFTSSYQGVDRHDYAEINFDLSSDWATKTVTLSALQGYFISYNLYIELLNVRGKFLFDNVAAEHSGSNWARDPFCNDINQTFTKAFSNIPKHWAAINLPQGAVYDSIYLDE